MRVYWNNGKQARNAMTFDPKTVPIEMPAFRKIIYQEHRCKSPSMGLLKHLPALFFVWVLLFFLFACFFSHLLLALIGLLPLTVIAFLICLFFVCFSSFLSYLSLACRIEARAPPRFESILCSDSNLLNLWILYYVSSLF